MYNVLHRNVIVNRLYSAEMTTGKQNIILNVCILKIFNFQINNNI